MIRRTAMVILYLPQQTNTCSKSATKALDITESESFSIILQPESFSIKLQARSLQLYLRETLAKVTFCEFCKIFNNSLFAEHLRVTASDVRMQVVVIYNLNLFLQSVTINFTVSLLFTGACVNVPELLRRFAFWYGYFKP